MKQIKNIKKRFLPQVIDSIERSEAEKEFEGIFGKFEYAEIKQGDIVKGQVVAIENDIVVVDVGLKTEGRIPCQEFKNDADLPKVNDIVEVFVEKVEGTGNKTLLSREKVIHKYTWEKLVDKHNNGEQVEGVIFDKIKGGFTVNLSGVIAFLPGSQVDLHPVKDAETLMNIPQPFYIISVDEKMQNIVVSRRAVLEESRKSVRGEMLKGVKEGVILEGIVKNITNYGAFIDLGSIDGLLHLTDISWSRINHPSEVLEIGQKLKVLVTQFNPETQRISLGLKQLNDAPWAAIQEKFVAGKQFSGKISNIADYGVFIELENGIEGLVHSSEISWGKNEQAALRKLSIGDEVNFVVIELDNEKHRASLSIKRCKESPFKTFAENNKVGDILELPIGKVADFGIFVSIGEDVEGLIHESDISWHEGEGNSLDSYKEKDKVKCKVLAIDIERERVSFGIKQLTENSAEAAKVKVGEVVTAAVSKVDEEQLELTMEDGTPAIIKKRELAIERADCRPSMFGEGDKIDAKVISVDKKTGAVTLSIKALEQDNRKVAIEKYGSADSGASLGRILGAEMDLKNKGDGEEK